MASDRSARVVGAFFASAGVAHFVVPSFFEAIVPRWFPDARFANQASGAAEIVLGAAMFPARTRPLAAKGLLALTAAVFPANIDMAVNKVAVRPTGGRSFEREEGVVDDARNWARLPFQFVIAWAVARHLRPRTTI